MTVHVTNRASMCDVGLISTAGVLHSGGEQNLNSPEVNINRVTLCDASLCAEVAEACPTDVRMTRCVTAT